MDHEALALLAHWGFQRYWIVNLYCGVDGLLRVALPFLPEGDHLNCPVCSRDCDYGILPAIGYTRRELPSWDQLAPPINWAAIASEEREELESEPKRVVDRSIPTNTSRHVAAGPESRFGPTTGHRHPENRVRLRYEHLSLGFEA